MLKKNESLVIKTFIDSHGETRYNIKINNKKSWKKKALKIAAGFIGGLVIGGLALYSYKKYIQANTQSKPNSH